jgi:signal peptidase
MAKRATVSNIDYFDDIFSVHAAAAPPPPAPRTRVMDDWAVGGQVLARPSPEAAVPEAQAEDGWARRGVKQSKPKNKTLSIISNLVFWVVCISLVVGSALFAFSKDPRKAYLGYRPYNVVTQSMTPAADGSSPPGGFKAGDLIFIKMCDPQDIVIGDIITFNPSVGDTENTMYLTHRVVDILYELGGKEGIYFVTKGDANPDEDPPISGESLMGKKVFSIPAVGKIMQTLRERQGWAITTVACFFGLIILLRWYFAIPGSKKSKNQTPNPTHTSL